MINDKKELRQLIFRHLDGLTIAPVAFCLHKKKVLDILLLKKEITLVELVALTKANDGYLNVALRNLASQGFIEYEVNTISNIITVKTNAKSAYAFSLFPLYEDVVELLTTTDLFTSVEINATSIEKLENVFKKYKNNFNISFSNNKDEKKMQLQILKHIEGYLVAPAVVSLGMTGMFHNYFMETSFSAEEFHKQPEAFKIILDFFVHLE